MKDVFVVLETNSYHDANEELMRINTQSIMVFADRDKAVDFVYEQAQRMIKYIVNLGISANEVDMDWHISQYTGESAYMTMEFPENRSEGETRFVKWKIENTWMEES